jgi:hypothetical protein
LEFIGRDAQKEETMPYQEKLQEAINKMEHVRFIVVSAIPLTKTVMIIFMMDGNELWLAEQNMKDIVRVIQVIGTNGYRLRMAAKMENGLTGLTMTLSEETVKNLDCSADVIEWAKIADEYNVAKGLQ